MNVRINRLAIISFLFVLLGSWNWAFAQFRLDIREMAGVEYGQEETGSGVEEQVLDPEDMMLRDRGRGRRRTEIREIYRQRLGKLLEDRHQNEPLAAAELAKLRLAGIGDIEKLMELEEETEEVLQNKRFIVIRDMRFVAVKEVGQRGPLFGAGSMLASVSKRLARNDPDILQHRRQVASAAEELLLTDLEAVMPLTSKQHKAVLVLLEKHRPISTYAHFRKNYIEAMKCLLDNSQELRAEFDPKQLKGFERIVGNAQNALKIPVPNL